MARSVISARRFGPTRTKGGHHGNQGTYKSASKEKFLMKSIKSIQRDSLWAMGQMGSISHRNTLDHGSVPSSGGVQLALDENGISGRTVKGEGGDERSMNIGWRNGIRDL